VNVEVCGGAVIETGGGVGFVAVEAEVVSLQPASSTQPAAARAVSPAPRILIPR
jgi:hypothetical protein